jgi:hypothetical protein
MRRGALMSLPVRRDAKAPLLLCVKPGLTGDGPDSFEANLASLQLQEEREYLHFS